MSWGSRAHMRQFINALREVLDLDPLYGISDWERKKEQNNRMHERRADGTQARTHNKTDTWRGM